MADWTPYRKHLEKTITIPDSYGITMVIQKIGKRGLEEASFVLQKQALEKMRELGGAEIFASLRSVTGKSVGTQAEAEAVAKQAVDRDPILAYDPGTLIKLGTKTNPEGFDIGGGDLNKFAPSFVEWLAKEIYDHEMEDKPKKG